MGNTCCQNHDYDFILASSKNNNDQRNLLYFVVTIFHNHIINLTLPTYPSVIKFINYLEVKVISTTQFNKNASEMRSKPAVTEWCML